MNKKKTQSGLLKAVSVLQPGDRSDHLYDAWAETYDHDLIDQWGYSAPTIGAEALTRVCPDRAARIIDLGCGTGLVGEVLAGLGYAAVDGLDVSRGMLDEAAKKGVYGALVQGDLTARTPLEDGAYDAVICIGSMGAGHVGHEHVPEMVRLVRPGGPLVLYMNGQYYHDHDYPGAFQRHQDAGLWTLERIEESNYMAALDRPGWLIVAHRTKS